MALAAERGLDGVTMRVLAERLGTTPMAAYHHVEDRDELVRLVVDAIGATLDLSGEGEHWDERLRRWAHEVRAALVNYPGTARWLLVHPPAGPNAFVIAEAALVSLHAAGFDDADAARAYAVLTTWVLCRCDLEDQWRSEADDPGGARRMERFAEQLVATGLPDQFPRTVAASPVFQQLDPATMFDLGLDLLLDGLRTQLAGSSTSGSEPVSD